MKRFIIALIFLAFPLDAIAALSANTVWELRTSGNDTNGGGFVINVSTKSTPTDVVINASDNTKVSSVAYGFTSADVGRYLQFTAGTGFNLGYFRITGVTSGTATLDAAAGTISSTGGTAQIYWGLDYTQQNAKNANGGSNGSSVVAVTAGTTTLTCSDCQFTNDIVGSVLYISGGTGVVTAQRYQVTAYTNATTVTVDRSTGLTAGTGVTVNIGGAIATFDELLSARAAIASNKVFVKADGTYTTVAGYSEALNPFWIVGYTSTRTDRGQAPLQGSAVNTYVFKSTAALRVFNMIFDCNSVASCGGLDKNTGGGITSNVTVKGYDGIGILLESANDICDNCEATTGTVNATAGIKVTTSGATVINSYVHDGNGPGIVSTSVAPLVGNIVVNQAGAAADCIQVTSTSPVINSSLYNCGHDGINNTNTGLIYPVFLGNVIVGMADLGIKTAMTIALPPFPINDGNCAYNNTNGNYSSNFTDRTLRTNASYPYVDTKNQTPTGTPFISTGSKNWGLNNTASQGLPCQGTGIPQAWTGTTATIGYPDMGAVTHNINQVPNFAY